MISCANDFEKFLSNLRMNDTDEKNKSIRFHSITKRLNIDFWEVYDDTYHSFYTGSQARGTDIYTSDIDMVMVLPYNIYERYNNYSYNGQSALLQAVRASLQKTYPSTYIGGDGQVVVVEFSDGMKFEVVPAFLNDDNTSYTYPDSNDGGKWKIMDPKTEIKAFNDMDKACNNNIKQLCKMIREWNKVNNVGLKGILIDSMAYRFLSDYQYKDKSFLYYDYMTRDFFKYIYDNYDQSFWYAPGSNWKVYNSGGFRNKAEYAYELALAAIEAASNDSQNKYSECWREIYGRKF